MIIKVILLLLIFIFKNNNYIIIIIIMIMSYLQGRLEELLSFRSAFGLAAQDPALPLPRRHSDATSDCSVLEGSEPAQRLLFAVSLFNTRTRRKYPAPGGAGKGAGTRELVQTHFQDRKQGKMHGFPSVSISFLAERGVFKASPVCV